MGIQDTLYAQIGSYLFVALISALLALFILTLACSFGAEEGLYRRFRQY